jgi:hypothetical protein
MSSATLNKKQNERMLPAGIPDGSICAIKEAVPAGKQKPAAMPAWTDLSWGWKPGLQK